VRGGADLERVKIQDMLRRAHFVPPTMKVDEMFNFFQAHDTRAAIVLGEFGEVLGIATIKDVLKFLFGEISGTMKGIDDYARDELGYIIPGDMRLLELYNLTNIDIEDPVMTTIGGVVFRLFGRLPQVGESVVYEGYRFTVLEVSNRRIRQLRVSKADVVTQEAPAEEVPSEAETPEPAALEALTQEEGELAAATPAEPDSSATPVPSDGTQREEK